MYIKNALLCQFIVRESEHSSTKLYSWQYYRITALTCENMLSLTQTLTVTCAKLSLLNLSTRTLDEPHKTFIWFNSEKQIFTIFSLETPEAHFQPRYRISDKEQSQSEHMQRLPIKASLSFIRFHQREERKAHPYGGSPVCKDMSERPWCCRRSFPVERGRGEGFARGSGPQSLDLNATTDGEVTE